MARTERREGDGRPSGFLSSTALIADRACCLWQHELGLAKEQANAAAEENKMLKAREDVEVRMREHFSMEPSGEEQIQTGGAGATEASTYVRRDNHHRERSEGGKGGEVGADEGGGEMTGRGSKDGGKGGMRGIGSSGGEN